MTGIKKGAQTLILVAGIIETAIAFIAYWIFFAISKTNGAPMTTPMVLLFSGMLGGILAIIAAVLIKYTNLGGSILSAIAAVLQFFATLFLIIQISNGSSFGDAVMYILPFFILPNALVVAGAIMLFVPVKNQEKQ